MEQYQQENPLFDLLYILRGMIPTHPFLFHHIFQYFERDQKLAIKLCRKLMNYQDCNQKNQNGYTPLQIAVIYNQISAIRYAQQDGRFDFNDQTLMSLAIIHSYFEIVEILLLDEGLSVIQINFRIMNSQSSTNLKILKKYEKLEIQKTLIEDTSEYQELIINPIPQFPIPKSPYKIIIETINEYLTPTTQCIENLNQECILKQKIKNHNLQTLHLCQENLIKKGLQYEFEENQVSYYNLFKCEDFLEQLLQIVFKFNYLQLDYVMLLLLHQFKNKCYYKNLDYLIEKMQIPIPKKQTYSNFDQQQKIENYCKQFKIEITQKFHDYKQQLQHQNNHFDYLKSLLSSKLKHDISYQGPSSSVLMDFQNQLHLYRGLFQILHKPYINLDCGFFILEQFELFNNYQK